MMEDNEIKKVVRDQYAKIANFSNSSCCGPSIEPQATSSCCGQAETVNELGYSIEELKNIPEGANLNLGCGNPTASANLKKGETVLDLGSGAGIDCFLAANKVGESG